MNHKRSLSFKVLIAQKPFKTEKDYKPAPRIFISGAGNSLDPEAVFKRVHQELLNVPRSIIEQGREIDHFCLVPQLSGRLYRPKYPFPSQFPFSIAGFKKLRTSMQRLINDIQNTTQNHDVRGYHGKPPYLGVMVDLVINRRDKPVHVQHSLADQLVVPLVAANIQHQLADVVDNFAAQQQVDDHVYAMNVTFYKKGAIMSDMVHTFNDLKRSEHVKPEDHNLILSAVVACDQRLADKIVEIAKQANAELEEAGSGNVVNEAALKPILPVKTYTVGRQFEIQIYGEFGVDDQEKQVVNKKIIVDIDKPNTEISAQLANEYLGTLVSGSSVKEFIMSAPLVGTITQDGDVNDFFDRLIEALRERYGPQRHEFPLALNLVSTTSTAVQIGVLFDSNDENHVEVIKKAYNLLDKKVAKNIKDDIVAAFGAPKKMKKFVIFFPEASPLSFDFAVTLADDHNGIRKLTVDDVGLPNMDEFLTHYVEKAVMGWNAMYLHRPFQPLGVSLELSQIQIDTLNSKKALKTLEKETKPSTRKKKSHAIQDVVIRKYADSFMTDLAKDLGEMIETKMRERINCIAKKIVVHDPKIMKSCLDDSVAAISEIASQAGAMVSAIDKVLKK